MNTKKFHIKNTMFVTIALLTITLCSMLPLLVAKGIPMGDDLIFHLARISSIRDGLLLGEFPVKVYPGYMNGYGYGNGLFYPDVFLYIPALLLEWGWSLSASYKFFMFLVSFGTAYFMYLCVKGFSRSSLVGVVGSLLYTVSSYRLVDVYRREALGEVLAFMFVPLVILGAYYILFGEKKKWYVLTIGFTGLFLSHQLSSVMMAVILAIMLVIGIKMLVKEKVRIFYLLVAAVSTVLLVSYFLFPMLELLLTYKFKINAESMIGTLSNTTIPITKVFYGHPDSPKNNFFPTGMGPIFLVILILGLFIKRDGSTYNKYIKFNVILSFISLFFLVEFFPWNILMRVPVLNKLTSIQFAWRFSLFATVFLSISCAMIIYKFLQQRKWNQPIQIVILFLICTLGASDAYVWLTKYMNTSSRHVTMVDNYEISAGEYIPHKTDVGTLVARGNVITSNQKNLHTTFQKKGTTVNIEFKGNVDKDTYIEVPLLFYKGYRAVYNGSEVLPVTIGENNVVRVLLDGHSAGMVHVYYEGTKLQKISALISIVSFVIFLMYLFIQKRKSEKR